MCPVRNAVWPDPGGQWGPAGGSCYRLQEVAEMFRVVKRSSKIEVGKSHWNSATRKLLIKQLQWSGGHGSQIEWVEDTGRECTDSCFQEAPLWSFPHPLPDIPLPVTFAKNGSPVSISFLLNLFSFLLLISLSSKISPFLSFHPLDSFWYYPELLFCFSRLYTACLMTTSFPFLAPSLNVT